MGKNAAVFPHPNWKYKIKFPRDARFSGAEFTRRDVMTSADPQEDETSGKQLKNCKNEAQRGIFYKMDQKKKRKSI